MPDGFSLNIDPKFMQDLEKAEQKIKDIATASEKTKDAVVDAFTEMRTQGLEPFVQAAKTFQQEMRGMRVVNLGLGVVTREASAATDKINLLVDALNKLLVANGKVNASNSKDSNVSKVNQLYKERLQIEERLHKMMLKGAQGKTVSPYESQNISRLAQRAQGIEQEIKQLQNSSKVSSQVILAIMKNEEQYTQAVQRFANERQVARNAEAEQQRKEAEAEKIRLAQLAKQRAEMYKKQNYAQNTTSQGALKFSDTAQTYNREKQAIEYLTIARNNLSKSDKDYANTLELLNKAIRKHEENLKNATRTQEELTTAQNKRNKASRGTTNQADKQYAQNIRDYNNAMKASEATINQRTNKLARLRQVEAQMAQDEARYAQQLSRVRAEMDRLSQANDNASKKTKELQKNQRNLMDTAGQLQRKLALLFSVSAIQGYVSKLVEVRGEFEMQQRSLQVLLQNKDEANALWDKTVALAVKSPFRIKDLVTYTKQLAAYRVESDKLFETNKMLADVSAGLGVDMNRLILAFGQVKAANYLRGTELRQFSEAGVNMLGELAKYFTELEGRAVSVGDVFERVSKRMVTFQDVNEIFKRITSEGGIFFKMQEKQSETLKGMIMNFRDSMDLMLNDIGKDQDSMLKNSIRLAKEFVDNWRQFQPLMESIGVAFLAAFGVKTLVKITSVISKLFAAFAANPILLVASAVGVLAAALYSAHAATTKLQSALREVETENTSSLEESIGLYKQLTQTINDTTKSYEERNKAMSQLENKFKDILPNQYIENDYVKQLGNNYREAEQAMFNYYNTKTREQKKARIEQQYEGDLSGTNIPDVISSVQDWLGDMVEVGNITEEMRIRLSSGVSGVINSLVEDVKSGKIASNVEEFNKELKVRLGKYAGIDLSEIWDKAYRGVDERFASIQSITSKLRDYASSLKSIKGLAYETYDQEQAAELINSEKNKLNRAVEDFKKVASLYQQYVDVIGKSDKEISKKRGEIEEDVQRIVNALIAESKEYGVFIAQAAKDMKNNADKGAFDFAKVIQTIESSLYATFDDKGKLSDGLAKIAFENVSKSKFVDEAATKMITKFQETLSDKSKALKMTDFQNTVVKAIELVTNKFGVSADKLAKFVPKYGEALSEVRNRVIAEKEMMDAAIASWDASFGTGFDINTGKMLGYTKEQISEYRIMTQVLETLATLMGNVQKGNGKRDKLMDERIKVIDQMNKKYKELNKTLSRTEALQGAFDAYKDAFADAYGRNDVRQMSAEEFASKVLNFPNENEIVKWLDNLAKTAKNKEDKIKVELAKGEYVFDMKVRVKEESDKALIDQIEDMFSGYEMSIELQKLNIPPDLAKQLFNIDNIGLDSIRKKIETDLANAKNDGGNKDLIKELEERLKKVDELEDKQLKERLKKYSKYLITAMGERVKIKMEEIRQINEIESLNELTDSQKELAKQGVRKESQAKMDKLEWEEFKNSGMYVQLFEDLEYASTKALREMRKQLNQLKGSLKNLDADDLKHLYSQIEKLDSSLASRNPFKAMAVGIDDYIKAIKKSNKLDKKLFDAQAGFNASKQQEDKINQQLALKRAEYEEKSKTHKLTKKEQDEYKKIIGNLESQLHLVRIIVDEKTKLLNQTQEEIDANKNTQKTFAASVQGVGAYISQAASALPQIAADLENIFGTMSETTKDTVDSISEIASGIGDAMSGIASKNYIQAVAGFAKAAGSIFAISDKKKERQIQREITLVADLIRAYGKLEKQIDKAYEFDTLKGSYDAAQKNIDAQIDSYEKMIAAEEAKKKTDKDRIKEWELAIEDLKEKQREMLESQVEELGGSYDFSSITEEFVNAWLDAFKETGNGLSGLEDNFEDFWKNIAIKQAVMGGASKIMQPLLDAVNKSLEDDFKLDDSEMANIDQLSAKAKEDMNLFLQQWYDRWGDFMTQGEQSELSGLQRGIQSVSESTAQIIEAYLNSVRFYVADSNTKLTQLVNQIVGGENTPNPILSELKTQTELVRGISTLLNSVVRGSHSMGGQGIKVFIS